MAAYPFKQIEAKWQAYWDSEATFRVPAKIDTSKPKYYVLDMFPVPVGRRPARRPPRGLYGDRHRRALQADARLQRAAPDGLGRVRPAGRAVRGEDRHASAHHDRAQHQALPRAAEGARLLVRLGARGQHDRPRVLQVDAVDLQAAVRARLGLSSGAARLVVPRARHDARERGSHRRQVRGRRLPCVRRPLRQWVLKITAYADALLAGSRRPRLAEQHEGDAAQLDRPQRRRRDRLRSRRHADGRSCGSSRRGPTRCSARPTWCSRPSTSWSRAHRPEQRAAVDAYRDAASRKSELERTELQKDKTGVFTGAYAINPANGGKIPIWIADYVLAGYGTGAIMAVPGTTSATSSSREKFSLPVIRTVQPPADFDGASAWLGDGTVDQQRLLERPERRAAKAKMIEWLEREGKGERRVNYKLRDWLFSRQRYWGEPLSDHVRRRQAAERRGERAAGAAARARGLQTERLAGRTARKSGSVARAHRFGHR